MHQALWLLTKLRFKASWRRLIRSAKTVRGAFLLLFAIGFLSLMVVPSMAMAFSNENPIGTYQLVKDYGPFLLLLYALSVLLFSIGDQALYFSPSEVDLLFPAPLARRELLIYKIANNLSSTLLLSLLLACTNRLQYRHFIAGLVGLILTLTFIQLLAMFTSLLGQALSHRAYTRGRRMIGGVMIAVLAFAASQALVQWDGANYGELPKLVEATMLGRILLSPFRVFCDVIAADQLFPDFTVSAALAIGMVATLVFGIFKLDADYSDVSVRVGRMRLEKQKQFQRGGVLTSKKKSHTTRIPMPPFLSGAGPLIWRQCVKSGRTMQAAVRIALIISLAMGIPLFLRFSEQPDTNENIPYFVWGAMIYVSTILSGAVPAGFRADIDRMEVFKNFPVTPWAIVIGQLFGPIFMLSAAHWMIFAILTAIMPHFAWQWVLGAAISPLFSAVLCTVSNGLFLYFPVKIAAGSNADFQTGIKTMLMLMLQYLVLFFGLGVVAGLAALAFCATQSWIVATATVVSLLLAEAIVGVFFVWTAYVRFDVTKHMPA